MKWSVAKGGEFVKRLSQPLEYRRDISLYGTSNLYPQMVGEVMFRSPITLSAVNALSDFTSGDGFTLNGGLVINEDDQSINDLLKIVGATYSKNNGWALHFNVNELGLITDITPVDFDYVRFGLPDNDGIHRDVKVNSNWEGDPNKTIRRSAEEVDAFELWQRRDELPPDDVEDFNGYILYWTPLPDQYPKATFDAVLDSAQTNGEIQIFELANIQNGFQSAAFYLHRGKVESEAERRRILGMLGSMKGAENANSVGLLEVPIDFDSNILESVAANNNDRLFELTNDNSMERIIANYGMPTAILGIQPDGGIFNQEQLNDAYIYYNLRTRNRRTSLSDAFNKFMQFWHMGPIDLGEIKEQTFTVTNGGDTLNRET